MVLESLHDYGGVPQKALKAVLVSVQALPPQNL